MSSKTRIYVVPIGGQEYLCRAASPSQALKFVLLHVGSKVRFATQDDLVSLIGNGATIMEAPAEPQSELPV